VFPDAPQLAGTAHRILEGIRMMVGVMVSGDDDPPTGLETGNSGL
jgi:hypothetical protein